MTWRTEKVLVAVVGEVGRKRRVVRVAAVAVLKKEQRRMGIDIIHLVRAVAEAAGRWGRVRVAAEAGRQKVLNAVGCAEIAGQR